MAVHLVLYRNAAVVAAANFANMNIVPFSSDNVGNNQFLPPMDMEILAAAAFGATLGGARIQTSLILGIAPCHIHPINLVAAPPTDYGLCYYKDYPIQVNDMENIQVQTSNTNGAGTDSQFVALWLGDKSYQRPQGKSTKIMLTGTTTVTAGAWSTATLTAEQVLPNGVFDVVGMEVVSATGLVARLDFPGWMPNNRNLHPGCVVMPTIGLKQPDPLNWYPFGRIGQFTNQTLPRLEIFCTAADTAQTVWLDVVHRAA